MSGEYLGNIIRDALVENGPMEIDELVNLPDVGIMTSYDVRLTVSKDGRFTYDDSGRVHLTTQNGET